MKSKVIQMGASNEPYEDLTEHIVIMCDREFLMQSNLRVYHPVELVTEESKRSEMKLESIRNTVEWVEEKIKEGNHDSKMFMTAIVSIKDELGMGAQS